MKSLVHHLLVADTMPLSLASVLVNRYVNAEKDENKFIQDLVETIADIKQPLVQVITTSMKENQRRHELQVWRYIIIKMYVYGNMWKFSFIDILSS